MTTVTTVGYGDINPADKRVRMHRGKSMQDVFMALHMIYIIVGVGTVGAAMALLVRRQTSNKPRRETLNKDVE